MRTSEFVQRLQAAGRDLRLPAALAKLDRFDLLVHHSTILEMNVDSYCSATTAAQ